MAALQRTAILGWHVDLMGNARMHLVQAATVKQQVNTHFKCIQVPVP